VEVLASHRFFPKTEQFISFNFEHWNRFFLTTEQ